MAMIEAGTKLAKEREYLGKTSKSYFRDSGHEQREEVVILQNMNNSSVNNEQ